MTKRRKRQDSAQTPWQKFERLHRRHPHLMTDTLYALPESLIRILQEHLPHLWSAADLRFEVDLSRLAGGGFFYRRPFLNPLVSTPLTAESQAIEAGAQEAVVGLLKAEGLNDLRIRRHFEARDKRIEAANLRAAAYTAWLVTNEEFLEEWDYFAESWKERVETTGRFPTRSVSLFGEQSHSADLEEAKLIEFFSRWSLLTFSTWDLPVPLNPQFFGIVRGDPISLAPAGLLIFLPWHLLRDESITLKDLSAERMNVANPDHLEKWFEQDHSGQKNMGYIRLRRSLVLYIYLLLGLNVRYPERLLGQMKQIDRAFADLSGAE